VSDNFLASDYITQKEMPYLLKASRERDLMIIWAYLEPCDIKRHPEILKFGAMATDRLEAMSKMTDWKWKETMLKGCDMIDQFLKKLECPVINLAVVGKVYPRIAKVVLLAKPSRRKIEVLVYSGDRKWWRQSGVSPGETMAKLYLGNDSTPKGTKYTIVAITTERPLANQTYLNLPDYRTKSKEIILIRG
jgi:hypothetical protein